MDFGLVRIFVVKVVLIFLCVDFFFSDFFFIVAFFIFVDVWCLYDERFFFVFVICDFIFLIEEEVFILDVFLNEDIVYVFIFVSLGKIDRGIFSFLRWEV